MQVDITDPHDLALLRILYYLCPDAQVESERDERAPVVEIDGSPRPPDKAVISYRVVDEDGEAIDRGTSVTAALTGALDVLVRREVEHAQDLDRRVGAARRAFKDLIG